MVHDVLADGSRCSVNSVLESIHEFLASLSDSKRRARLIRVIQRSDIRAQLEEQDRRLDALINALQVLTFHWLLSAY